MSQFMLSVHSVEEASDPSWGAMEQMQRDVSRLNERLGSEGRLLLAGTLKPADTASTVACRGDELESSDGPFSPSKSQISSLWIVDADDVDAAFDVAAQISKACQCAVEVREFREKTY